MKKRFLSVLLVLTMLVGLLVPTAASAEEYLPLSLDEEVTVTLAAGETKWYQFTPDATKTYSFVSYNDDGVDPVADLYDSSMTLMATGDDNDGANFLINAVLTAGETYYLEAYEFDSDNEGSYTLKVGYSLPTDIFFDEYAVETFVGTEYTVTAHIYPEDADKTLTWTSSDESVATVDESGKVTFLSAGETQITAETPNGLSDDCRFTVYAVDGSLELDTEMTLEYIGVETRAETQQYFTFTPAETGYYRLYSYDIVTESADTAIDPRAWVYDVFHNELGYNDDGGEDVNVSVQVALEAGETYYFMTELYDSEAVGSIKFKLEEMSTAESVAIDCGDLVMDQGNTSEIYVTYAPEGSWQEGYVVTSSDNTVVKVDDKTILAVGEGEATVTVTTDLGLTDSITVTVIGIDEIELDTVCTVEGNADDYGASARYTFTPSVSGRYTIASSEAVGEGATVSVSVSDASNQLRYNDTQSNTFSLTYVLQADTTYYYDVQLSCEAEIGSVDFTLTKEDDSTIPSAKVNTDYLIDITNPGDGVYYVFKPFETGLYAVFSAITDEQWDTKLEVYTDQWELFYSDDDGAGESQYRLEEEFVAGETYYLKSFCYSNDDCGSFNMSIEPLFDLTIPACGDADGNGEVSSADARLVLRGALELEELTERQKYAADMNGDGVLNSTDARAILRACVTA